MLHAPHTYNHFNSVLRSAECKLRVLRFTTPPHYYLIINYLQYAQQPFLIMQERLLRFIVGRSSDFQKRRSSELGRLGILGHLGDEAML